MAISFHSDFFLQQYTLNNEKRESTSTGITDTGSLRQSSSNVESGPSALEPGVRNEATKDEVAKSQLKPSPEELRKSGRHRSKNSNIMLFGFISCSLSDSV